MAQPESIAIEFRNVEYRLASGRVLLDRLNLQVRAGETLMLLGRSGSGKTTCLKTINRLIEPTAGEVLVDGKALSDWDVIRLRRSIGYAIQDVGLFPHYTVRENVGLVPKLEGWEPSRIRARVDEVLALVGLPAREFGDRFPAELSGGQRQRVGLARAVAAEPPILLMDEPFGALDPLTRSEVQLEFRKLQDRLKKTVVFVTHDVGEALLLGDRIAVMQLGRLRGVYAREEFRRADDELVKSYMEVVLAGQSLLNE
jgi:osmoprotectant transport system ATP-binding protein